eukprot:10942781-Heterocapsa_arctica.AAC.1
MERVRHTAQIRHEAAHSCPSDLSRSLSGKAVGARLWNGGPGSLQGFLGPGTQKIGSSLPHQGPVGRANHGWRNYLAVRSLRHSDTRRQACPV